MENIEYKWKLYNTNRKLCNTNESYNTNGKLYNTNGELYNTNGKGQILQRLTCHKCVTPPLVHAQILLLLHRRSSLTRSCVVNRI
jgi:hypothetical protein